MRAHIRSYAAGKRHAIEIEIATADRTIKRAIGRDMNATEFAAVKLGAQSALLLAGFAVSSKHQVLTSDGRQ